MGVQPLPRGCQNGHTGTVVEDGKDEVGHIEQMLQIVQHQQQLFVLQIRHKLLPTPLHGDVKDHA